MAWPAIAPTSVVRHATSIHAVLPAQVLRGFATTYVATFRPRQFVNPLEGSGDSKLSARLIGTHSIVRGCSDAWPWLRTSR